MRSWQKTHDICVFVSEQLARKPPEVILGMDFGWDYPFRSLAKSMSFAQAYGMNPASLFYNMKHLKESIARSLGIPKEFLTGVKQDPGDPSLLHMSVLVPRPAEYVEMKFELTGPGIEAEELEESMRPLIVLDEAQGFNNGG